MYELQTVSTWASSKDIHQYNWKYTHLHKTSCKGHKNKKLKIQVFWDITLLLLAEWFLTFERITFPSSSRPNSPSRNIWNHTPSNTLSCPRRFESPRNIGVNLSLESIRGHYSCCELNVIEVHKMYTRICPITTTMTIAGSEIIQLSIPEPLTQTFLTK